MKRKIQWLNGFWNYSINGVQQPPIKVPFSNLCVGDSQCDLFFDAILAPRAELCFEGITYSATVILNGTDLGSMVAYSRYVFDISSLIKPTGNHLSVKIKDMNMPFGPSEGWENYGGIIRDVYITYTDSTHIEDIIWRTKVAENLRSADCEVTVQACSEKACIVKAELFDRFGDLLVSAVHEGEAGTVKLTFTVEKPDLWSPEFPNLYRLDVSVGEDVISQKVGIKDFKICGQRFVLNGKPTFIKGICRHDMWGDQGYTLTEEQMIKDMRLIKDTGCNYVRLVHYPHHPKILEIADEIGLLVSEEPGLWWSDMHNPKIVEDALEVMERVVRRDRNHCSVAFWLAFNECIFTPEFLEASSAVCRRLDPDRPVSGANAMNADMTKEYFKQHGFDFYTRHPYTFNINEFDIETEKLNDMPLIFTEWGGLYVYENKSLFEQSLQKMLDAWYEPDGGKVLAGCAYWVWADMYEFGRGESACFDGILREGLVDIYRNSRGNLNSFTKLMHSMDIPKDVQANIEIKPIHIECGTYNSVNIWKEIDQDEQDMLYQRMIEKSIKVEGYYHKTKRRLKYGPMLKDEINLIGNLPVLCQKGRPVVIEDGIKIPVGKKAKTIYVVGNVAMPWGYPLYGEHGEVGANYIVHYTDGSYKLIEMRNGIEITTALGQQGPSRIMPIAAGVELAACFSYDLNWEHYIINLYKLEVDSQKEISHFEIKSCNPECTLLLYGLTTQA